LAVGAGIFGPVQEIRPSRRPRIITTLKVPKTGGIPTTKANVLRWLKHEGETISRGEPVVELETEKVSYELESPIEGVLLKILVQENSQAPVGEALCQIGTADESSVR
jgi:pyruvate/2-oxoglutarate dehydrogenase complex dihydrolipoamide acyltransferase (E2) component